jgi:DnaJ-class molecular chaperone
MEYDFSKPYLCGPIIPDKHGREIILAKCPRCDGTGKHHITSKECNRCHGKGNLHYSDYH